MCEIDIANAMATVLWDGDEETGKVFVIACILFNAFLHSHINIEFGDVIPITDVDEALIHEKVSAMPKLTILKRASSQNAKKEWNTYFKELGNLKKDWFNSLKDHLSNIERLHLHDTLRTRLVSY